MVSDVGRVVRWYGDNAGLPEMTRRVEPQLAGTAVVNMARGAAGLTLIEIPGFKASAGYPQMVCLVLDGPPEPPSGSEPRYLTDPDGSGVELPPAVGVAGAVR